MIRFAAFQTKATQCGGRTVMRFLRRPQALVPPEICFRVLSSQLAELPMPRSCHQKKRSETMSHKHQELMRKTLQRYGFYLSNVNPLLPDGFLVESSLVRKSVPKSMFPILNVLSDMRKASKNASKEMSQNVNFLEALNMRMNSEHVALHEDDTVVLKALVDSYCDHIGFEFDHCNTEAERQFFIAAAEDPETVLSKAGYQNFEPSWMFQQLYRTAVFQRLLHERYSNAKTFGIEGMEAATLAINTMVESFANSVDNPDCRVLLGTSHRGRINYLGNCLKLPWTKLISDWDETRGPTYDDINDPCSQLLRIRSNDKKDDTSCRLTMVPIPCHLEAMVPGLLGAARAQATELSRGQEKNSAALASHLVLPLSLHGDSSFCGQGIIQETLQLSTCRHYESGGTIHLLLNNQVGFTTELPSIKSLRFQSTQSSDVAKSIGAPILHVNANQPHAVVRACQIALLYRQTFGADILIDLIGWRRGGHNEMDDPTMTNVRLQSAIIDMEPVTDSFQRQMEDRSFDLQSVREEVDHLYQSAKAVRRDVVKHEHYDRSMGMGEGLVARLGSTSISKEVATAGKRVVGHSS